MRPRTAITVVVMALMVLSGCAADTDGAAGTTRSDQAVPALFDFTGETLEGATFDGRTLAGKPTVLWFWAPWCPTCRAQAPGVSRLAEQYDDRVNVVGVGGLSDATDIRDFAAQVEGPLHLIDVDGALWRHFGVRAQSTYLVLDATGGIVADGYLDDPVLAAQVAELAD